MHYLSTFQGVFKNDSPEAAGLQMHHLIDVTSEMERRFLFLFVFSSAALNQSTGCVFDSALECFSFPSSNTSNHWLSLFSLSEYFCCGIGFLHFFHQCKNSLTWRENNLIMWDQPHSTLYVLGSKGTEEMEGEMLSKQRDRNTTHELSLFVGSVHLNSIHLHCNDSWHFLRPMGDRVRKYEGGFNAAPKTFSFRQLC